jgi:hypothetical protein
LGQYPKKGGGGGNYIIILSHKAIKEAEMEYLTLISAFLIINGLVFGWIALGFWRNERRYKKIKNEESNTFYKE